MSSMSGSYYMSLDDKGRTRVPAKCKAVFDKTALNPLDKVPLVITIGQNKCLTIMTEVAKDTLIAAKKAASGTLDTKQQKTLRLLSSLTFAMEEDAQGRFVIPSDLRKYASITKDIVYIGVDDRVELWDAAAWNSYSSVDGENEEEAINSCLAQFGF